MEEISKKISELAKEEFFINYLDNKINELGILLGIGEEDDEEVKRNRIRTHLDKKRDNIKSFLKLLIQIQLSIKLEKELEPEEELEERKEESKSDKIRKILKETPEKTDFEIMEIVGCSLNLITDIRRKMKDTKIKISDEKDLEIGDEEME